MWAWDCQRKSMYNSDHRRSGNRVLTYQWDIWRMRVHGTDDAAWLQLQRLLTAADVRSHCAEDARSAGQRTVQPPTRLLLPRSSSRRHRAAPHEPGATAIEIAVYWRTATGYCRPPDARRCSACSRLTPPRSTVIFCRWDVEITEHAISACHAPFFLPSPHFPAPSLPDKNLLALGAAG